MASNEREVRELRKLADQLQAWSEAWWWQVYKNHRDVMALRPVLRDAAVKVVDIANRVELANG